MSKMCTLSVNDMNNHKFSHGTASYTLNGKTVKVTLEYRFMLLYLVSHMTKQINVRSKCETRTAYQIEPQAAQ